MSRSPSWDMSSSSPSPGKSDYKKYTGRLQRQESEIRRDQLEENADYKITVTGPGAASIPGTIKLYDNLFDTINPTTKKSYWKKHKLSFVGFPDFNIGFHNTLNDAYGKGVVLEHMEVVITKIPMHKRLTTKFRKTLRMKSGGRSRDVVAYKHFAFSRRKR